MKPGPFASAYILPHKIFAHSNNSIDEYEYAGSPRKIFAHSKNSIDEYEYARRYPGTSLARHRAHLGARKSCGDILADNNCQTPYTVRSTASLSNTTTLLLCGAEGRGKPSSSHI